AGGRGARDREGDRPRRDQHACLPPLTGMEPARVVSFLRVDAPRRARPAVHTAPRQRGAATLTATVATDPGSGSQEVEEPPPSGMPVRLRGNRIPDHVVGARDVVPRHAGSLPPPAPRAAALCRPGDSPAAWSFDQPVSAY